MIKEGFKEDLVLLPWPEQKLYYYTKEPICTSAETYWLLYLIDLSNQKCTGNYGGDAPAYTETLDITSGKTGQLYPTEAIQKLNRGARTWLCLTGLLSGAIAANIKSSIDLLPKANWTLPNGTDAVSLRMLFQKPFCVKGNRANLTRLLKDRLGDIKDPDLRSIVTNLSKQEPEEGWYPQTIVELLFYLQLPLDEDQFLKNIALYQKWLES